MKKIIIIALIAIGSMGAMAQVKWSEGSFADIKKEAVAAEKLVFVDFYATWCGPCKYMEANIFPTKVVGEATNDFLVSAKFDAESGQGKKLAKQYKVVKYPTLLIIDPKTGEVLGEVQGSKSADDFASNISQAILTIANQ